jgi:uncharacterized protein
MVTDETTNWAWKTAVSLFNNGQFYQCHHILEDDLWRPAPDGPLKLFYQAILQLAVGCYHAQRSNPVGANSLWLAGLSKLRQLQHQAPTILEQTELLVDDCCQQAQEHLQALKTTGCLKVNWTLRLL